MHGSKLWSPNEKDVPFLVVDAVVLIEK